MVQLAPEKIDVRLRDLGVREAARTMEQFGRPFDVVQDSSSLGKFMAKLKADYPDQFEEERVRMEVELRGFVRDVLVAAADPAFPASAAEQDQAAQRAIAFARPLIYASAFDRFSNAVLDWFTAALPNLRRHLSIMALSNAVAFSFALALTIARPKAARHLVPVSALLGLAILLTTLWYLFGQDWILAILFDRYWGWSYTASLLVIAALLADIALNRARLTTVSLNALLAALGAAASLSPL